MHLGRTQLLDFIYFLVFVISYNPNPKHLSEINHIGIHLNLPESSPYFLRNC